MAALHKGGRNIPQSDALGHVFGYAVGLDLTRRDQQAEAKKKGRPWDSAKAFDHSAPCSAIRPSSAIGHPQQGFIELDVNGSTRQKGDLAQMIWAIPEVIMKLSQMFELVPGDLIFTGTPAGVSSVVPGDRIQCGIEGVGEVAVELISGARI